MENVFCTIITANYLPYAHVLYDSLYSINNQVKLIVFVSDEELSSSSLSSLRNKNIEILYYSDIKTSSKIVDSLKDKYARTYHDAFRWAMKPVLLTYILNLGYQKAIYVDSDILFFNDFSFLFDALNSCALLLSPHWRSSDPHKDPRNFSLNFLDGIYNGGFVGASCEGIDALDYWAACCLYAMERNREKGMHDDQKYLDILPSRYKGVESIRHKGCNVGNWNQIDCERTKSEDGKVLINGEFDIIFIHFTKSLYKGFFFGEDKLLKPYVTHYFSLLEKYNVTGIYEKLVKEKSKESKAYKIIPKLKNVFRKLRA